jgi:signal transduction histidine kinase
MARPAAALALGAATAVAVTLLLAFGGAEGLELPVRDLALRLLPRRAAEATAIVAIDEKSLRAAGLGPWPWTRERLAELVDDVAASGARGVVVDVLLAEPRPGDEALSKSLARLPSAAVCVLDENGEWVVPAPSVHVTAGHGNFELDRDGIVRRLAATKQSRDRAVTALAYEAASMMRNIPVPVGLSVAPELRTAPRAIPAVSAADLMRARSSPLLRDRVVFLGSTAFAVGDRVLTPVSHRLPDPGVTVHAATTESLLRGEIVRETSPVAAGLFAGFAVGAIVQTRRARRLRMALVAALVALVAGGGMLLLGGSGIAVPFVILLAAIGVAAGGVEASRMTEALRRTRAITFRMESGLGLVPAPQNDDVAPRLEEIATRLAERRAHEAESKRLLAHELKTPLASMRGLTQLLGGYELSEVERKRVASLLEAEAGKLQSMVSVLLDLERLPLRDFDAAASLIDLGELVSARVEFLRAGTGRDIRVSAAPGVQVRGDAALIERIVDNLAGNALKYTAGAIDVRVLGDATIEVADEGPGIGEAERARIFDRFFRGSTARGTQGLGLGLALVAEVARWHGGEVALESGAAGSRFRVTLPLATPAAKAGGM